MGISGRMGSGKDTLGDMLVQRQRFVREAFADTLKKVAELLVEAPTREYYQRLALLRQVMGKDVWVIPTAGRVTLRMKRLPDTNFVITDVRYPNEANWIKANKGIMIRLDVMDSERRHRVYKRDNKSVDNATWGRWQHHESENQLNTYRHFDMILESTELTPETVYRMVLQFIVTTKLKDTTNA